MIEARTGIFLDLIEDSKDSWSLFPNTIPEIVSFFSFFFFFAFAIIWVNRFMQIEKALINNRLCVSKVSWKFYISTIYNFAVISP